LRSIRKNKGAVFDLCVVSKEGGGEQWWGAGEREIDRQGWWWEEGGWCVVSDTGEEQFVFSKVLISALCFNLSTCHTSMTWNGITWGNLNGAKIDSYN